MRRSANAAALFGIAVCSISLRLLAQEGFPLDGTWRGEWGSMDGKRTPVVMVMEWDGENVDGTMNPGPGSIPFDSAALDPSTWMVTIEVTSAEGEAILAEGRLHDIGSYNRFIEGTWTQNGTQHRFRITRE